MNHLAFRSNLKFINVPRQKVILNTKQECVLIEKGFVATLNSLKVTFLIVKKPSIMCQLSKAIIEGFFNYKTTLIYLSHFSACISKLY